MNRLSVAGFCREMCTVVLLLNWVLCFNTLALIFLSHCDSGFPVSLQFWSRGINRLLSVKGQSKDVLLLFGLASKKGTSVHFSLRFGVYGVSDLYSVCLYEGILFSWRCTGQELED